MIAVNALISLFQRMYKEHWSYIWGEAQKYRVDCSGAFVYAYKHLDQKSISHGSNAIARRLTVGNMLPLSEAQPGMAAFKVRQQGEEGWDLPSQYRKGGSSYNGDVGDYYHIGLVDDDPRYVLNAKSTKDGFCRDELISKKGWDCVAYLKDVDYGSDEKGDDKAMKATVVLPIGASGTTVNMRDSASKSAKLITRVPVGTVVDVIQDKIDWCQINYDGQTGWMMSNYLDYEGQGGESSGDVITPEEKETIEKALEEIERQIDAIRTALGRG